MAKSQINISPNPEREKLEGIADIFRIDYSNKRDHELRLGLGSGPNFLVFLGLSSFL